MSLIADLEQHVAVENVERFVLFVMNVQWCAVVLGIIAEEKGELAVGIVARNFQEFIHAQQVINLVGAALGFAQDVGLGVCQGFHVM